MLISEDVGVQISLYFAIEEPTLIKCKTTDYFHSLQPIVLYMLSNLTGQLVFSITIIYKIVTNFPDNSSYTFLNASDFSISLNFFFY